MRGGQSTTPNHRYRGMETRTLIEINWARMLQRHRANKPTSNNAQLLPRFMICACPDSSFYPSSENGGLRKDPRLSFTNFRAGIKDLVFFCDQTELTAKILSSLSSSNLAPPILWTVLWLPVPRVPKSHLPGRPFLCLQGPVQFRSGL